MSVNELFTNGYTIIPSLISDETCDKLKKYLDNRFHTEYYNLYYNYSKGHCQMHLSNSLEHFPTEIVLNEKIHQLLADVFKKKNYYMYSYTCNANIAPEHQPYHMDCSHYHPIHTIKSFGSPGPPMQLIVNTYLQDTNEMNGSFDIVPKSHRWTDFEMGEDGQIDNKYIKNSVRCNLPKGSVIIRDKRTWHRGTKNISGNVRYMVGTSYSINWYKLSNLQFKKDCEEILYDAPFSTWNLDFT